MYEFYWSSPVRELRAAHAMELPFVFDRITQPDGRDIAGTAAPQRLADGMYAAWVRFIATSDPGWPAFGAHRDVQLFDDVSRIAPLRRAGVLEALRG